MTEQEKLDFLKNRLVKRCTNAYPARSRTKVKDVDLTPKMQLYKRNDLYQWSKEAFERGEDYFYVEPVNPKEPNGALRLCEPRYEYVLPPLTEEQYKKLFEE